MPKPRDMRDIVPVVIDTTGTVCRVWHVDPSDSRQVGPAEGFKSQREATQWLTDTNRVSLLSRYRIVKR